MNLTEICKDANQTAIEHGWREEERNFGELVALMHCELSEAMEEWRNGTKPIYYGIGDKPEGILSEFADVIIRIAEMCGHEGWDLEKVVEQKLAFNKTRPYRHGNKRG